MPLITLTSDWKQNDYYLSGLKGVLTAKIPDVQIVDITHQVKSFGLLQAAYVVKNSYHYFPKGSIHFILVQSVAANNKYLILKQDGHYFICADNGVVGLLFDRIEQVYEITEPEINAPSFPELSVFTNAAVQIVKQQKIDSFGALSINYLRNIPLQATIDENTILGSVIYIDSHRNIITNIIKDDFERIHQKRKFEIAIGSNRYRINKISNHYLENPVGELLALFNTSGHLEVSINQGNAADLLSIGINGSIRIKFL